MPGAGTIPTMEVSETTSVTLVSTNSAYFMEKATKNQQDLKSSAEIGTLVDNETVKGTAEFLA